MCLATVDVTKKKRERKKNFKKGVLPSVLLCFCNYLGKSE